jgi:toxin ParE1/3/4
MAYKIRWSPRAASNFEDICNYIAKDSKYYASLFAKKVNAIIKTIPQFPRAGRVVPEYNNENLREKIYENYRIVYRLKEGFIEVVAICHGAKPLDNIL